MVPVGCALWVALLWGIPTDHEGAPGASALPLDPAMDIHRALPHAALWEARVGLCVQLLDSCSAFPCDGLLGKSE